MARVIALLYGLIAYLAFAVTIIYSIGFVTGLVVPKTVDSGPAGPPMQAIIINLLSILALAFLFWQWQPIPAVVWQATNPQVAASLLGLSLFGWVFVFVSTFLINHFELFGLHQVANNLVGRPMPA